MHLTIDNKNKQEICVAIFQLLKNWSSHINMNFESDKLYIQSMDKSHVCLADIVLKNTWFTSYECATNNKLSVDSNQFAVLINYALKHEKLELKFEDEVDPDKLYINFLNDSDKDKKGSFNHYFELNLIDVQEDGLEIPEVDYDVDFLIDSKKLVELLSELNTFGQDLNIKCTEDIIELNACGESTKLKVNINIDDLNEYGITEGGQLNVSFSLNHLYKMCCSTKLCSSINVLLISEYPMSLKYSLGDEKTGDDSKISFYIAPKVTD